MSQQETSSTKQNLIAWAPHVLVVGGVVLAWLSVDPNRIVLHSGFLLYGIIATWAAIRKKYYSSLSLKLLKLLNGVAIAVLAIVFFSTGLNVFFILLLLMMSDNIVLTNERVDPHGTH